MMIKTNKKNDSLSTPEFGIDSRYQNKKDRLLDGKSLLEARLKRLNALPKSQVVKAKLLQLQIQMEDYLLDSEYQKYNFFTSFLSNYIDIVYDKRVMFAKDINISAVSLSQILNNHREPKEEFMFRLMIHSELTFKNISNFQKKMWYQVYYHEKISDTMANQNEWKPEEKKNVKIKNAVLK